MEENFEDEDLTQNPEWAGDVTDFTTVDESGNILLQLDAPDADNPSVLTTTSSTSYGTWEFFYRFDQAASNSNQALIFLLADTDDIDEAGSSVNGYAVRTGETGSSKRFRLFRYDNGSETEILTGETDVLAGQGYQIRVTRNENDEWNLYIGEGMGSTPLLEGDTVTDVTYQTSSYFGIWIDYTSTRRDDFFFDDIIIENSEDFTVANAIVSSANELDVIFNYQIEELSLDPSDFSADGGAGSPESVSLEDDFTVRLTYGELFEEGNYTLTINAVENIYGGEIDPNTEIDFSVSNPFFITGFAYLNRNEFDITFSQSVNALSLHPSDFEISGFGAPNAAHLEDPDRVRITYNNAIDVGERELIINNLTSDAGWEIEENTTVEFSLFDEYEEGDLLISEFYYRTPTLWRTSEFNRPQYIEIYNRANKLLNLRNFTINGENISIDEDLSVSSGEYLAITRGVPVFEDQFGARNFVEADEFPALVLTTSDEIILETDDGEEVESLTYDANLWGGNEVSLERFSFDVPASFRDNWAESEDVLTGSPGLPNTITEPSDPPEAVEAAFPAPQTLRITFFRTLSNEAADNLSNFALDNSTVINAVDFTSDERILEFELDDLLEDQYNYTLSYQGIEDIFGNGVPGAQEFNFTFINPFRILAAEMENESNLLVQFTLPLQVSTVDLPDFERSDGTVPQSFEIANSETVRLFFADSFSTGSYEIVVNNLESLTSGWEIEENSTFGFSRFDEYQEGDIVINEFMYRPPNGYPKYVELYNRSDRFLTLKDFELRRAEGATGNGGPITEFDQPIEPGGYIVVTENLNIMNEAFGSGPWFEMGGFPGFTQTVSDQIRLIDPDGDLAEAIDYDPSAWGGNTIALERRSINAAANDISNWGESLDERLGTPGEENSVGPDDGPALLSATFIDAETVLVSFSGSPDTGSVTAGNFDIDHGLSVAEVNFINSTQVEFSLNSEMNSGLTYTITVTGIPDIFGNELEEDQTSFTYYFVEIAGPGDIVINEFMYDEPDGYTEYIELYNKSNKVFSLAGWQQANDTGIRRVLTGEEVYFPPGTFMVVLPNEELFAIFPDMPFVNAGSSLSALKNSGDEIVITNAEGITLDSLRYSSEWGGDEVSLERIDTGAASSDMNNWGESLSVLKGTPGEANSVDINTDGPELLGVNFINAESITVKFSGALDRGAISKNNFVINHGVSVQEVTFTSSTEAVLFLDQSMSSGRTYTLTVQNIPDIFGNKLDEDQASFTFYLIEAAEPGDVVINEIMYNPPEEYTRYIELYNRSNKAVDLAGWQQANDTATRRTLTSEQVILPPDSYIAILPNFNLLTIFPDIPYLNAGTGITALKNGGDNIVIANADSVIIDSLRYSPVWGGDGVALERRQTGQSSLYQENWADSPGELFGTPGMPNQVNSDFHFTAIEVRSLSPVQVRVEFNAAIREDDIETGNFSIAGIHPNSISVENSNILILEFAENLERGRQILMIDGVRSAGGFAIPEHSEFIFTVFDEFSNGDILINEFMYRPPSGYVRYVELVNRSSKLLNLRNWRLQRRDVSGETGRIISAEDLPLEPGEYIVLAEDAEVLTEIFGERNFFELSDFPGFTITVADQIRLFTSGDIMADSLQYEPLEWGGDGVALERLNMDIEATFAENWAESPNELLGTPGLPNEAVPDSDPPEIVRAAQYGDQGFVLAFNKRMNSDQATAPSNYSITPVLPISMIALDGNEVYLFAGEDLINDQIYEITVSGLSDLFGNELETTTVSVLYLEFGDAEPGQIVINEIMYEPDQNGAEFIEIFNRTGQNFDLSGWLLSDASGSAAIPAGVSIRENDYLVFSDSEIFAAESEKFIYLPDFQSLNNSADATVLKNPLETVIDSLFYRADWGMGTAGISLERKDPAGLSSDSGNWASGTSDSGATPGRENSRFEIDESPPEIIFANFIHPDSVQVLFNEYVNPGLLEKDSGESHSGKINLIGKNQVNAEARFLMNGVETSVLQHDPSAGNRVILDGSVISPGEEILVRAENLGDYKGNTTPQLEQPVAQPVSSGDIIFNEIMFDPISDNRDGLPDQSQYIEIHNRRSYAISLEGFFLHDEPDENENISLIEPVSSYAKWIPARGYVLIYPEPDEGPFSDSRTARFFDLPDGIATFSVQTNRTTLSLPNNGRQIYLADSTNQTIDKVEYSPGWHNPNIIDTKGIALERINPDFESNDGSNWGSNATPLGGSPGTENSIYQGSDLQISGNDIAFSPNPFSPDDDGYEDNLLISYSFDEPDYLIKVRIYDRYGRLVRKLAEAKPAGFEGSLVWDGKTDDGLRNRIGIYIVLFEAYNSSNGRNHTFKETVVIARKF